jgi:excisionase family DNA binding protein
MTISEGTNTSTGAGTRTRSATPKTSSGEYLTVEQAAEYLNITDHFVRRLIRERRIPFVKVGRLVRLRRTDIDDYLAGRLIPAVRR